VSAGGGDPGVDLGIALDIVRSGDAFRTRLAALDDAATKAQAAADQVRQEREALGDLKAEREALAKATAEANASKAEYDRLAAKVRAAIAAAKD